MLGYNFAAPYQYLPQNPKPQILHSPKSVSMETDQVILASSSVDAGIACWDLRTGEEKLRYRTCASSPHGLLCIARTFLASSQLRTSSSASIFVWAWDKPQVEVKSFPAEPIGPLVADSKGYYIIGGSSTGTIYLWERSSGSLLTKWSAHIRAVTCLTVHDDSLLVSGSADGSVKIWSLMMMFGDEHKEAEHFFSEHTLPVTDVASGIGSSDPIIVSASEDRTCKIWSLSQSKLLRSISFPCKINAIAMDPAEYTFYAGGRDGKIYIAALGAEYDPNSSHGMFIIGSLSGHSEAITCLTISVDGMTLVSGSEDGTVRIWDTKSQHVTRILKHAKGPVNNVLIVKEPSHKSHAIGDAQGSHSRKRSRLLLPPALDKYVKFTDGVVETKTVLQSASFDIEDSTYCSSNVMKNQIKELQQQGSSGAMEMELERLRLECKRLARWKKLYLDLHDECVKDLMNEVQ